MARKVGAWCRSWRPPAAERRVTSSVMRPVSARVDRAARRRNRRLDIAGVKSFEAKAIAPPSGAAGGRAFRPGPAAGPGPTIEQEVVRPPLPGPCSGLEHGNRPNRCAGRPIRRWYRARAEQRTFSSPTASPAALSASTVSWAVSGRSPSAPQTRSASRHRVIEQVIAAAGEGSNGRHHS